jgi:ABC-type transport system substrate-binding protein
VGVCNNETGNEITDLHLVLSLEGSFPTGPLDRVNYDDLVVDKWIAVNNTNPTDPNPPPSRIDSDGFPAQALHVYWILKSHGYTDADGNIFLMLYHTGDDVIDIKAGDGISNDLNRTGIEIDVENDDVNSSRFKQELNVSISGSFASGIIPKDQLIIFMTDHGSN